MDRIIRPGHRIGLLCRALPVLLALSACSAPDPSAALERVHSEGRALSAALGQAVDAVHDAQTGYADAAFAGRAVGRAESGIAQFAAAARAVEADPRLSEITAGMETSARSVVGALQHGDTDGAEAMLSGEFVPLAARLSEFTSMTVQAPSSEGESAGPGGFWPVAGGAVVLLAVAGVAVSRLADRNQAEARRQAAERLPSAALLPGGGNAYPATPGPATEADLPRTARSRSMTVDLQAVLSSAVRQMAGRGWSVNLICPEHVRVAVDPLRLQRVLTGFLAASFLKGAQHAGIVVETREDLVLLSIGDDSHLGAWEGDGRPPEVAHQLERAEKALAGSNVTVGWVSAEGVSMYTLQLERQEADEAEAATLEEPQVSA